MIALPVGIVIVLLAGLGVALWLGRREYRSTNQELAEVRALTADLAERRARELLADSRFFEVRRADPSQRTPGLPPAVQTLLAEYEEVVRGEFWIGRAALAKPSKLTGHIKIGEDFEFTEMFAKPDGLEVYTVYGGSLPDEPPDVHRTVWHKLVEASEAKP